MATKFAATTAALLQASLRAKTSQSKGKLFEDLVAHLFSSIRGVEVNRRNAKNPFQTEEIDVALWNDQHSSAVPFLPWIILVECKNWTTAVGSEQVSWFDTKLRNRGIELGILFAANGITGDAKSLTDAHLTIATALRERRRIVVLTSSDVTALRGPSQLVSLLKQKLCDLAIVGTTI
ncbi:restriction endonuclease [Sorangium sp. So ce381]|uniref:restriction endonuclease n=1 Tax=Sorangium sp. So ce381 TaxID=3133307 RepID=UPI003F5B0FA2